MKEIVTTNYFWGQDVEMSQFYRVPKALYTGEYFRGISFEAKAIYGMMIDRVSLSIKNGWLDEDGKTYIHYSVADIMADTGCGKNKVLKCLKELEEDAIDGIDEYQAYSEIIRENIDMDSLVQRYPYEQKDVQEIYDLIVETVVSKGGSMTISGQQYPREVVKSRFLKLNMSHVEYVMECLRKNTTKVYNIKAYLLAALFNAGTTMSNYYRAEVNHDIPQFAG